MYTTFSARRPNSLAASSRSILGACWLTEQRMGARLQKPWHSCDRQEASSHARSTRTDVDSMALHSREGRRHARRRSQKFPSVTVGGGGKRRARERWWEKADFIEFRMSNMSNGPGDGRSLFLASLAGSFWEARARHWLPRSSFEPRELHWPIVRRFGHFSRSNSASIMTRQAASTNSKS
eukprot:scaffold913_cov233-Pinguiococcus_pyrenoidosus.AAC.5